MVALDCGEARESAMRTIGAVSLMSCVSYFVAMCILSPLGRERQMAMSSIAAAPVSVVFNLLLDVPFGAAARALRFWPPRRPSCASSSGAPATCSRPCAHARPGAHGGVQRGRRRGVRGLRMVARDRVLRRSRSDRNRGPVGLQCRRHRRRSCPARRHRSHAGGKGPRGLAARVAWARA